MILTKDTSRLGRDHSETGFYIEKYFPSRNIRYIAVTDSVDTFDMSNTNTKHSSNIAILFICSSPLRVMSFFISV